MSAEKEQQHQHQHRAFTEEEKKELIEVLLLSARCGDTEDIKTILDETKTTTTTSSSAASAEEEHKNPTLKNRRHRFVDSEDEQGRTALFFASANGHLDAVKMLVEDFNADVAKTNATDESTPLHWACLNGHSEVVKFLLEKGGKNIAFALNKNNRTPMDEAMHNDRQDCVKVIMDLTDDESNHGFNRRRDER